VNPDCRILVTGCYAQRAPEELAALPGVTWVVGNSHSTGGGDCDFSSFSAAGSSTSSVSSAHATFLRGDFLTINFPEINA